MKQEEDILKVRLLRKHLKKQISETNCNAHKTSIKFIQLGTMVLLITASIRHRSSKRV